MLNEVKHLALSKRDSSASPQNDTHHLTCDVPLRQKQKDKKSNHQHHSERDAKYSPFSAFYR